MRTALARTLDLISNPYAFKTLIRPTNFQVMVVEDDAADAYLIRRALFRNPRVSQVVMAKDGVEALELIDDNEAHPDLAVVDLHMPRKDGFTFLTDLSFREFAQFPSIVLTSSTSRADCMKSWKRGAVEFLTKQNTVDELATSLGQAIARLLQ